MTSTILVILGDREWTNRALHLSGALAREWRASVVLVMMTAVTHLEYLGDGVDETLLSYAELNQLQDCLSTVESYGVTADTRLFQYSDYVGGLLCAAEQMKAAAVFAPAPAAWLPGLARLQRWWLRRRLGAPLYTLGEGDGPLVWTPPTAPGGATAPAKSSPILP
jgi:hypothetical protein